LKLAHADGSRRPPLNRWTSDFDPLVLTLLFPDPANDRWLRCTGLLEPASGPDFLALEIMPRSPERPDGGVREERVPFQDR